MKFRLRRDGSWTGDLALGLLLVYLATFVLDSPIRYGLSLVGVPQLMYLRDGMAPVLLAVYLVRGMFWGVWPKVVLILCVGLFVHTVLGVLFVGNLAQVAFGIKVLLPLLGGCIAGTLFRNSNRDLILTHGILVLWSLAVLGVGLEFLGFPFPWKGFQVEVAGVSIEGNREWSTGGLQRLAGFGRMSADTSYGILLLASLIAFRVSIPARSALTFLSIAAIVATTTKGAILASLFFMALVAILSIRPRAPEISGIAFVSGCAILVIGLPTASLLGWVQVNIENPIQYIFLGSFLDRILNTWPDALALLLESPIPWLGRGVGGIGSPQQYFEPALFTAGDNQFMYFLVLFGPVSLLYMGAMALGAARHREESRPLWKNRVLVLTSWLMLGLSSAPLESSTAAVLLGFALGNRGHRSMDTQVRRPFVNRLAAIPRRIAALVAAVSHPQKLVPR